MSSVSLDQILGELEKTESVTDNQIINGMLSKDNIEVKTEIPIPPSAQNVATLKVLWNHLIPTLFGQKAAKIGQNHLTYSLEFAISHNRGSREEVVKIFQKTGKSSDSTIAKARTDLVGQIWGR